MKSSHKVWSEIEDGDKCKTVKNLKAKKKANEGPRAQRHAEK